MKRRRHRNLRIIHLSDVHYSSNYDIDITFQMKPCIGTTNYDALMTRLAAHAKLHPSFIQYPHHAWWKAPRLRFCEALVSLTAPKGRIDELIGDHRQELRDLISQHGERWGISIRRFRLISETCRMLPTIALRVWAIWRATR
jgi:hypothetical protein